MRARGARARRSALAPGVTRARRYIIVPLSTNGGGDKSPITTMGKFVTAGAMVFGVIFLSMPLAIVGNKCVVLRERSTARASATL